MKWLVAAVFVALVVPSGAGGATLTTADGTVAQPYQSWVDASRVPVVADAITVYTDDATTRCDVPAEGCSLPGWVFVDPALAGHDLRAVFMHEMGHEFDAGMPDWKRAAFMRITRRHGSWDSEADYPPVEEFADTYSECSTHRLHPSDSTIDYASQWRRACRLIRQ
jgi:hypothetical protein